jgi:hypothetical protein
VTSYFLLRLSYMNYVALFKTVPPFAYVMAHSTTYAAATLGSFFLSMNVAELKALDPLMVTLTP